MIDIKHSVVSEEMAKAVFETLSSGRLAGTGTIIEEYERGLAEEFGSRFAVACSSGTTAVSLAILASGIPSGSTVAVPSIVPTMTPLAVIGAGCIPHFVDIGSPETVGVSFDQIKALALAGKIQAVVAVAMWGYPSSEAELAELCEDLGIVLIEDASHAHMATLGSRKLGTYGRVGAFSTHERKLLFTGEGGFCLTDDETVAVRLRALREFGRLGKNGTFAESSGYNFKLASPLAALGHVQVRSLEKRIADRQVVWGSLYELARQSKQVSPIELPSNSRPSTYGFLALAAERETAARLQNDLEAIGVLSDTKKYNHRPVYEIGIFKDHAKEDCKHSRDFCERAIALPAHEGVSAIILDKIGSVI
ncbi:dTDP-4-amino-4,6-dideoxygalactose transaminase [Rhizobium leguminosarum]|uniref:dTDP-4-amino-4,6-dideoxygalactose transaminase n=1 Tax=Rhizobium leguminosarum TaxID=384 RepID=A0AAE2MMV6_RHILE|nr:MULTISPECIES: DegT/DnrJ/EryC1/StrS family aminotransferase [Rhizobium]MBB4291995.1 dTDP-4-amino-4,6-dideoxygalactose transaminase [Rhizobium leguminosarum]MBB4310067.1 dTDP-4-amino-4,6-dideoxygalactose transaminase [Rhizobium leguminosarum]MBB4419192.1 dTDP-4-amino-4,6-dideoxygalactose transaminase [Rhizobium leguminosarum]MBB4433995.1 dTDP-4-amino-4,6-dideoxygalactose transaminase [Rhizobium esperanzae]MBB4531225.1 dTDP-4-amino-4,6-dideoxygalactose transaminase [Rhizobium leguminosarum]